MKMHPIDEHVLRLAMAGKRGDKVGFLGLSVFVYKRPQRRTVRLVIEMADLNFGTLNIEIPPEHALRFAEMLTIHAHMLIALNKGGK